MNTPERMDARTGTQWTVLQSEWLGHVRMRGRVWHAVVRMGMMLPTLLVGLGFAVAWPLYQVLRADPEVRTERDWFHLCLQFAAFAYLAFGAFGQLFGAIPEALRWRRRGAAVWDRAARVCPDCLAPFDDAGRSTCRHGYSASMQPGIMRLLESEVTDDPRREQEARRALADARAEVRGQSALRRKVTMALNLVGFVLAFWIVAGPFMFQLLGAAMLSAILAMYVRRASRVERCTVECVACGHLIHDIAQQAVCPECGRDLCAPGSVRSAKETRPGQLWMRRFIGGAVMAGVALLGPSLPSLLSTSMLIALIGLSIGRVSQLEDELARRPLTPAEQTAATGALIRHQLDSVQSWPILADFARQTASEGRLDEDTLDAIGSGIRARWRVGDRSVVPDGSTVATVSGGEHVEFAPWLPQALSFVAQPVVLAGPVSIRRLDGAGESPWTPVADGSTASTRRFRLPPLEAGRYELRADSVVACMPWGVAFGREDHAPLTLGDIPASVQRVRRQSAVTLVVGAP